MEIMTWVKNRKSALIDRYNKRMYDYIGRIMRAVDQYAFNIFEMEGEMDGTPAKYCKAHRNTLEEVGAKDLLEYEKSLKELDKKFEDLTNIFGLNDHIYELIIKGIMVEEEDRINNTLFKELFPNIRNKAESFDVYSKKPF